VILEKNILTIGNANNYRAVVISDASMSNESYSDINEKWVTNVTHLKIARKKTLKSLESKNGLRNINYNFTKEDVKEAPEGTDTTTWYILSEERGVTSSITSSSPTKILFERTT